MPATLYFGRPGSGKTTLMRGHVTDLIASNPGMVFLIVNHGEKPGQPSWRDLPNHRVFRSIAEFWHEPSRVAVFEGVPAVEVAQLAIDLGWSIVVDDECDDLVSDGKWKENPLREIVKRGRHLANRCGHVTEVMAFLATHRPANLPTDLGLLDRVYIGRLDSYNDAERILREGWVNARNPAEVQALLKPLAPDDPRAPGPRDFLWYP